MPKPFQIHDPYFIKAKKMGYRARSAFKLLELQERYNLIKPNMNVLDVGAAPGSFLQVIAKIVGQKGKVVGIDIQKIDPNFGYPNIFLLQESIFEYEKICDFLKNIGISNKSPGENPEFDLITSDIAPATTGMTGVDQYKSVELNLAILEVAKVFLKKDATLVLKVFVGEDVNDLIAPIKQHFKKLSRFKPKACRDRSFEEYFICQGKK
ncbi:MAG: RlmE family RNA methyltransferase [Candidatus Gracilibacteria bacterium]|nr:RlmE family RNA methyltransferase [Candidatus Gracilibacteria bacterium]